MKQSIPIKQVQLLPRPYAHQTQVKVNMTKYSLLLGNTGKTVVWENWHINPFQVFYTAMFLVTAYVEQLLWKAQRQHRIGPLCSLPYLLSLTQSQTLFLQQLHTHIWSSHKIGHLRNFFFYQNSQYEDFEGISKKHLNCTPISSSF